MKRTTSKSPDKSVIEYSEFYSREKRLIIPLTNYCPFHKVSDIGNDNPNFIERHNTSDRLKNWLDERLDNSSGSYLITGYRGMGKSSFVGKVVDSLFDDVRKSELLFSWSKTKNGRILNNVVYFITYLSIAAAPFIFHYRKNMWYVPAIIFVVTFIVTICKSIKSHQSKHIHYIKINIGNEIRNERDILAILSSSIADTIKKYVKRKLAFRPSYFPVFSIKVFFFFLACIIHTHSYSKS